MNIYTFEVKSLIKNTVIWMISLSAVCVLLLSLFPAFADSEDMIREMLKGYPPEVMTAFSLDIDSFFGIYGFYSFMFVFIILCGTIQAANLGTGLISRENRAKTADFLLTKPVKRCSVITAKLLAALTALAATNIVYLIVITCMCTAVKNGDFEMKIIWLMSLTMFFIQLVFVAMGAVFATFVRKIKSVTAVSLGLSFSFYFLSMIDAVVKKGTLKYITPFSYFDLSTIAAHGSYEWSSLLTVLAVCTVCLFAVYTHIRRMDIHAV